MKEIPLTQGKVAIVDDEDYEWLMKYKWIAAKVFKGRMFYAVTNNSSPVVRMHRLIMDAKLGEDVDHINHNGLYNCKSNLRKCPHALNQANRLLNRNNTSGFKGVSYLRYNGKWKAEITVNQKRICLGQFVTAQEAGIAYDASAIVYFGEFALTNSVLKLA